MTDQPPCTCRLKYGPGNDPLCLQHRRWDHAFYPVLLDYSLCQMPVCAICGEREHP